MDKVNLIQQLAQEMKMNKEKEKSGDDQYNSSTGTLETDPYKTLETLKQEERKKDDIWDRLKLKPTDFH
ncbi:MAG: hypothetical protein PWP24_1755 [Clostridiales bacterium]|nr:hypothetical protein [Clostridiales bacterium]